MSYLEIRSEGPSEVVNAFFETLKRKATPYFQRGMDAVIEQRQIRTFDEAADIIKARFIEHGTNPDLAEEAACIFARAYIAGVVSAARLVAPDLVAQFAPCLEGIAV